MMVAYAITMMVGAVLILVLGILIYRGKTNLIHDYHQKRVKDKMSYGKDFGKGMFGISTSFILSGMVSFIENSNRVLYIAIGVFAVGFIISWAYICRVQKKYNGGFY